MSKVKSAVICVLLAIAIVVAALFATISFPAGEIHRINSIAGGIHLGADLSGYAYATVYPKGVISQEDYESLSEEDAAVYVAVGSLYVDGSRYDDIDALKADVEKDAEIISSRIGRRGYSSYAVSVEDGISIKISVPTNYTYAAYRGIDSESENESLSAATTAISNLAADGKITLRTVDSSIELTDEAGTATTYTPRQDDLYETALVDGSHTYSIAGTDDVSEYFESITSTTFGNNTAINFKFTEEGRASFSTVTTRAASSESKTIYFFVGDTQLVSFPCESTLDQASLSLMADSVDMGQNAAITLSSVLGGEALSVDYEQITNVIASTATAGDYVALWLGVGCLLLVVVLVAASVIRYKRLGIVNSIAVIIFALVATYALNIIGIQTTFAVVFCALIALALLMVSNAVVFTEVRRLVATGRTMQTCIKEAYKNVLMTVTDMHIVLFVASVLLAAVGAGEVAACGLIMVVGTIASYVLYWFSRLMWYVLSAPVRDKFAFAGLKRVVYDDED